MIFEKYQLKSKISIHFFGWTAFVVAQFIAPLTLVYLKSPSDPKCVNNYWFTIITQVATYFANALVRGVSNPDLEQKT